MTRAERLTRVEREAPALPVTRQCELLALPRSTVYHKRLPAVSDEDLALMRLLDELHLKYPFMGSRRLRDELGKLGRTVNRKRVQRLMQIMGLQALYPRKRMSLPNRVHRVFPYLLRNLAIDRPNPVWAADISMSRCAGASCIW
jgi:putative transposase